MVKIKNICNESGVGAFYHSPSYSPTSHTLPFEPYIGEIQLKLDESMSISISTYTRLESFLKDLKKHHIIDFVEPVVEAPVNVIKEIVEKAKKVVEPVQEVIQETVPEITEPTEAVEVPVEVTAEDVFKKTKKRK